MTAVSDNKASTTSFKADATLDDGWEEQVTTDGDTIYVRPSTGEVTLDRPIAGRPVRTKIRPPAVAPVKRKVETRYDETRLPLGDGKFVTVNVFRDQIKVHVREFYENEEGVWVPTKRGITINPEQWKALCQHKQAVEEAIRTNTAKMSGLSEKRRKPCWSTGRKLKTD